MLLIYSRWELLYGMLAAVFGVGMVVISWRMMRSGEGQYDSIGRQQGTLFNTLGLLLGLALAGWGAWVLWRLVPEYIFW